MPEISAFLQYLVQTGGYLGVIIANAIGTSTIIFPVPGLLVTIALVNTLNPWLLGIATGLGSAIGELTGYAVGKGGKKIIEKKYGKTLKKVKKWTERHGTFPIIVLFASTPLPTDIIGILSGMIDYDIRKFFLAVFIGKTIISLLIIFSITWGLGFVYSVWV